MEPVTVICNGCHESKPEAIMTFIPQKGNYEAAYCPVCYGNVIAGEYLTDEEIEALNEFQRMADEHPLEFE